MRQSKLMPSSTISPSLKSLFQNELCMCLMVGASFLALLSPDKSGLVPFEGEGIDAKCRTHRWETRVPRGCVITAGTDADITVVHLGCAQAMRSPRILQIFILLPPEACQHLQLRFAHLTGLIVSPVVFLIQKETEIWQSIAVSILWAINNCVYCPTFKRGLKALHERLLYLLHLISAPCTQTHCLHKGPQKHQTGICLSLPVNANPLWLPGWLTDMTLPGGGLFWQ